MKNKQLHNCKIQVCLNGQSVLIKVAQGILQVSLCNLFFFSCITKLFMSNPVLFGQPCIIRVKKSGGCANTSNQHWKRGELFYCGIETHVTWDLARKMYFGSTGFFFPDNLCQLLLCSSKAKIVFEEQHANIIFYHCFEKHCTCCSRCTVREQCILWRSFEGALFQECIWDWGSCNIKTILFKCFLECFQ